MACGTSTTATLTLTPPARAGCLGFLARLFGVKPVPSRDAYPAAQHEATKEAGSFWDKFLGADSSTSLPSSTAELAEEPEVLPYRLKDRFFSRAEASFFRVLQLALPDGVIVCPKVNLHDIIWSPPYDYTARNRIDRKHVDFVLADAETLQPLCGIELDDSSHQRPDRQERDRFVERVFAAAGLPLVRVPVRAGYNAAELAATLREAIGEGDEGGQQVSLSAAAAAPPTCPRCRTDMVVRTARSGANAGQKFYGCPNYPRCRNIAAFS
jgi:hypothetical protein